MEAVNRKVFETNQAFNHAIIYPVAKGYRDTVPEPVRDRVDAFSPTCPNRWFSPTTCCRRGLTPR